jgi:lipopolysaccharide/colanic/teichoic acid biosynthesis glycosyltransferase
MGNSVSEKLFKSGPDKNNVHQNFREREVEKSFQGVKIDKQLLMNEKIHLLYIGSNEEVVQQLAEHPRISLVLKKSFAEARMRFISGQKPDVVLCENNLPGGDGLRVHYHFRKKASFNTVPFILITPDYEEGFLKTALQRGIDDLYVLPIPSIEDLLSRIDFLREVKQRDHFNGRNIRQRPGYRIPLSKRLFDIVVASTALILLSPILLLVMIAIRIESKGKVYYTSKRVGREPFDFYKFRSMKTGAEDELKNLAKQKNQYVSHEPAEEFDLKKPCPCSKKENFTHCSPVLHTDSVLICEAWYTNQKSKAEKAKPHFIKITNDPRVTRVGKIIRNTSIDELPQLINVIKGDMSIVGNRPLPIYEAEKLTFDPMAKRFLAPAGLTGLWQVEKRGRKGVMSDEERKSLDNQYAQLFIENKYSFMYDMKLIMRTLPVIIQKESV